jgi:hypothetical protein
MDSDSWKVERETDRSSGDFNMYILVGQKSIFCFAHKLLGPT